MGTTGVALRMYLSNRNSFESKHLPPSLYQHFAFCTLEKSSANRRPNGDRRAMLKTYDNSTPTHSLLGARTKPSPNRLSPGEWLPQILFQQTATLYNYLLKLGFDEYRKRARNMRILVQYCPDLAIVTKNEFNFGDIMIGDS